MQGLIMTAQLLLSLSILIAVHEGGHFVAARIFKIKVEKFYLFFDFLFPMANVLNFSLIKFKKGDTEYGIGWFPLGGYVKIAGMVDESMDKEQLKKTPEPWEFRSKPAWQRLIVMLGGIIVNVVVGILIFICLTWSKGDTYIPREYVNTHGGIQALHLAQQIGLQTGDKIVKVNGKEYKDFMEVTNPDVLLSEGSYYTVLREGKEVDVQIPANFIENFNRKESLMEFVQPRRPAIVDSVLSESDKKVLVGTTPSDTATKKIKVESIAKKTGLRMGDQFVEVNNEPVLYIDEVNKIVKKGGMDSISFKVRRGDAVLAFKEDFKGRTGIGFAATPLDKNDLVVVHYDLAQSIPLGTTRAFKIIFTQLKAFKLLLTFKLSPSKSLSGPIGMAKAYGGQWDWERFWHMTGLLSMVLAFMNLLPIPALDGGYVVFLLYEMITGKEASEKFFENSLKIGFAILIVLMAFTFYNDIAKLFVR